MTSSRGLLEPKDLYFANRIINQVNGQCCLDPNPYDAAIPAHQG